jgi:microcystin-dependent protein
MPIKISETKGVLGTPAFDTFVPLLTENANIQDALELFYYGNLSDGSTYDTVNSIYANLLSFQTSIASNQSSISGHVGATAAHGATGAVVGTTNTQTLSNKTLESPIINLPASGDGLSPIGSIIIHAGSSAPTGWLLCDGTSYPTTTHPNLFNTIGHQFGGSGLNFNVPNLKGKVVVGIDGAQAQFDARGETGGAMTHQHAASNSGNTSIAHNHSIDPPNTGTSENGAAHYHGTNNHSHNYNPPSTTTSSSSSNNSVTLGSGYSHANSGHTHTLNIGEEGTNAAAPNTGNADVNHSHTVDIGAFGTTGGEGGSHAHTTPVSDSLSNLQPYMALNYIIKH